VAASPTGTHLPSTLTMNPPTKKATTTPTMRPASTPVLPPSAKFDLFDEVPTLRQTVERQLGSARVVPPEVIEFQNVASGVV
jgi:hypothetical protein